jgi:hypothetical protein
MLINKGYEVGSIVTFKLSNGDEVVGKLIEETDENYVINKPVAVVLTNQGINMVPALFTGDSEKNVPISKKHVMMHSVSLDKAEAHYIQTTTGIQPATKGSVIV